MQAIQLPPPQAAPPLAFADKAGARAWLAGQPQTDPDVMLAALLGQLRAIEAAGLPPAEALPLISVLRIAAVPLLLEVDQRFLRKALPLPAADQACFGLSLDLWQALARVDLQLAAGPAGMARACSLLRAAMAVRHAYFACFQAAQAVPPDLAGLFLVTLRQAVDAGALEPEQADPDFADLPPYSIAGELLTCLLLLVQHPYQWSAVQLTVGTRILRRWRSLLAFQGLPDADPKTPQISLARLFPDFDLSGLPLWIDLRPILRKLRKRQEALAQGESPADLKLGNELSSAACQRLLQGMAQAFRPLPPPSLPDARLELMFGGEHAYAFFTRQILNRTPAPIRSSAIAHQRLEIFGFDELSRLPGQAPTLHIPRELWTVRNGLACRAIDGGGRHLAPVLVAGNDAAGERRLGTLRALCASPAGLEGRLQWFALPVRAAHIDGVVKHGLPVPKYPVFQIGEGAAAQLVVPPQAGLTPGARVTFASGDLPPATLGDIVERGADFVIYACPR